MEKRLTAQGPKDRKSFTVTLPLDWIKKEGLNKKRQVDLEIIGHKVIISASKEYQDRTHIDGDRYKNTLIKVLQGLYRLGVNEIKLSFTSSSVLEEATEIIEQYLMGYEIIEQEKDYILIRDIARESEESFKVIFRRIFLLLQTLMETKDLKRINSLDRNIKKLINYCQRILVKRGHIDFTKVPLYYLMLDRLEKIGDSTKWMQRIVIEEKSKPKILGDLERLFKGVYELFYKFDNEKYAKNQHESYILLSKLKLGEKPRKLNIHLYNHARLVNSLHGDLFTLAFKG